MRKIKLGLTIGVCLLALGGAAGCGQVSGPSTKASSTTSSHSSHKTKPLLPVDKASHSKSSSQSSDSESATQASVQSSQTATSTSTVKRTTATSSSVSSSAPAKSATMDFNAIKAGDYNSLIGNWRDVAEAYNSYDGNGVRWGSVDTPGQLTITTNSIRTSEMSMNQDGVISSQDQTGQATFSQRGGALWADADVGAIAWSIAFFPKGQSVASVVEGNTQPTGVDNSREHVVVRTSNNGLIQVFERQ
ncbi:hypothetical protein [Lacticaseibacillus sp. GG6-2]